MGSELMREITPEEVACYERDGFVRLRGVLPADWVNRLRNAIDEILGSPGGALDLGAIAQMLAANGSTLLDAEVATQARSVIGTDQWHKLPSMGSLCLEPPLPGLAARLFGSTKVNLVGDQVFRKEPGAARRTAFHSDESYFHCIGEQCATFWIPVDVVDSTNAPMGYVPGSHRWGRIFQRNTFVSQDVDPTSLGEKLPDIEGNEGKYGVVYLEAEPGDILVHNYRTIHGSRGNTNSARGRSAAAIRYGGDDLHYIDRGNPNEFTDELKPGDALDSRKFPVVWANQ